MNLLKAKDQPYIVIFLFVILTSIISWLPFILKQYTWFGLNINNPNFGYIYKNYDGPLYIIPAKSLYIPRIIDNLKLELPLSDIYFVAHLPLYPLFISFFVFVFGYLKSMIFVNILFTVILSWLFYYLAKNLFKIDKSLSLTFIFLMLPRFLVVRTIGAPESLFIFLTLLSLLFFERRRYFFAGLAGGLATMTKIPGILLFIAYFLTFLENIWKKRKTSFSFWFILLIPLSLILVFVWYWIQYKDFFAYFHTGGFVPMVFPFSVFNYQKNWVSTAWLEDVFFYFLLYLLAVINLSGNKYRSFFYFALVFLCATTFVQHRDISRYSLPIWPLACLSFAKFLTDKKFLVAAIILIPAVYLYAWNFLVYNILPISDWKPFI